MGRGTRVAAVGLALGGMMWAGAQDAEAQRRRDGFRPPRAHLELDLLGAQGLGQFGDLVGAGFGGQIGARFMVGERSPLYIRLDGGGMIYGLERLDVCFPTPIGCRIGTSVTTTNSVVFLGVGPELAASGPVAPYVFGTVGIGYFSTQSNLSGWDDPQGVFNTRHYGDLVTAARAGGGLRFRIGGPGSVSVDLGAAYHRNGVAEYLREGDILDNPDGSITVFPNRTEANFVTFRAGVSIPLGGGRDDPSDDWNDEEWREDRRRPRP